jgi:hypothetical protein
MRNGNPETETTEGSLAVYGAQIFGRHSTKSENYLKRRVGHMTLRRGKGYMRLRWREADMRLRLMWGHMTLHRRKRNMRL